MNNSIGKLFAATLLATVFTSCLKDKNVEDRKYGTEGIEDKKVIEIAVDQSRFISTGLDFVNRDTIINFAVVRLAAESPAQEDINVTLTLAGSPTMIADYNTANGTSLVTFPSNLYAAQGNGLVVTIPKGSREGYLRYKVNPGSFDPSTTYALGLRIASVDKPGYTISQNFGSFIGAIGAKNKYDGVYTITGSYTDVTNAAFQGAYPYHWELRTVSANSCAVFDAENFAPAIPAYIFYTGSAYSYYANFGLIITFDPNTNKVASVTNYYGQPASNSRSAQLDPSGVNAYDPAAKTVKLKYYMLQPSVVTTPPNIRARFDETWTYDHAR